MAEHDWGALQRWCALFEKYAHVVITEESKMSSSSNRRKRRKEPEVIVFQEPASSSMGLKRGREAARERQQFPVSLQLVYCVGVAISPHLHVYPIYLCLIYDWFIGYLF